MVAFRPISPSAALLILHEIAPGNEASILCSFVEGGMIRAYARVVETLTVGAGQSEVRDAQVPRPLWKRIVADGRTDEVLTTGSVKLTGDGLVGGRPDVMIVGVRFNEANVRDAVRQHGPVSPPPAPPSITSAPTRPLPKVTAATAGDTPPLIEIMETPSVAAISSVPDDRSDAPKTTPQPKRRATLPDGDVMVSIADAMDILDVSRGTIGNMVKRGDLDAKKIGTRTLIPTHSIRTLMAGN